jgi:hypothetical protein
MNKVKDESYGFGELFKKFDTKRCALRTVSRTILLNDTFSTITPSHKGPKD